MNAEAVRGERLHALDAVRGGALLLGVVFHACLAFMPGPQIWIVEDASQSVALSVMFYVLHIFRMSVFFLLAGFFARLMLKRRGLVGFVANRAVRIAAPLVAFWPFTLGSIIAVLIWVAVRANGGVAPQGEPPPPLTAETFPLTHLWFLYVLLIFYAGALLLRALVVALDRGGGFRAGVVDPVVKLVAGPAAAMFLAAPVFAALYFAPRWYMWFGVPTPDTGLFPNWTALAAYGVAFGFGWLVSRQQEILQDWARHWPANLGLGIACAIGCLAMVGVTPVLTPAEPGLDRLLYAAMYALAIWGWTLGLVGFAVRFCAGHSSARRYIADASYWIYIVHLPIVLVLQAALAPYAWPWFVKFPLILAVAFALMLASYQLMVRYSFVGAILNGKRRKPERTRAREAVAAAE